MNAFGKLCLALAVWAGVVTPALASAEASTKPKIEGSTELTYDLKKRPILGPDAQACLDDPKKTGVLIHVHGFKDRGGNIRVELFSNKQDEFLEGRKKLLAAGKLFRRVDVKIPAVGDVWTCIELPQPGQYSLAILHDRNANGKLGLSDGAGFPGNPKLKLSFSKPSVEIALINAQAGTNEISVVMNYVFGLSVRPIR